MKNMCYFYSSSKQLPSNRNHPFEPRRNWKIEISRLREEQSYMQLMGEEYSKEEILRIPPTFFRI
jgi:acetoin utilization deacetylase AcuC-like enzyme